MANRFFSNRGVSSALCAWVFTCALFAACAGGPRIEETDAGIVVDAGFDAGPMQLDAGPLDAGLPFLPLGSACSVLNARRCEYWTRCGLLDGSEDATRACLAYLNSTWCGPTRWTPRVQASPATLQYDGIKGQQCADALATQACDLWLQEPTPCTAGQMLKPNVVLGQGCYGGGYNECAEGVCKGATCPRSCEVVGTSGDICNRHSDCRSGLYCLFTANGVGQCKSFGAMTQPCDVDRPCADSLTCINGQCVPLPLPGNPCLTGLCDSFSYCVANVDGGTCLNKKAANAMCTDDSQCGSELLCDELSQTCQPTRVEMLGGSCTLQQTCKVGPACVGASTNMAGICRAPLGSGESCLASSECKSELACANLDGGTQKHCGLRVPHNGSCATARDCQALSTCHQGLCVALPLPGNSCSEVRACLWGPCVAVADGGAACAQHLGPGMSCSQDSDCSSERCFKGQCLAGCAP
jgi:hypothetical protein